MVISVGAITLIVDPAWLAAWSPSLLLVAVAVVALALKDLWTASRKRPPTG